MRRDIRRRVFCPVISPAWRRRIGSGPLAAAVGASARTPRSSSRIPKRRRAGRPWRVRPMPCYVEGGGCSNLWAAFGADRWAWFIRKKLKLNPKSPPGLKRWNSPNLPARAGPIHVCFSNRPFGVKHFQTIHQCGVDVARGLVLLFGIGTWALPSWDPRTRRNNL